MRAKYRVKGADGLFERKLPLSLGVHPKNRGGVYPQPERVPNLGIEIHEQG